MFDADNTLWDTDSVFRRAQISLLEVLREHGLVDDPEQEITVLRQIDQEIARRLGIFEYDFRELSSSLVRYYAGERDVYLAVAGALEAQAAVESIDNSEAIIKEATDVLRCRLQAVPPLFPDTAAVLRTIRSERPDPTDVVIAVFSEGDSERLNRILEAHSSALDAVIDELVIAPKNPKAFFEARSTTQRRLQLREDEDSPLGIMIGDALRRDVKFANQAGFITVYKPAAFKGIESPESDDEVPTFTAATLNDLLPILRELHVLPMRPRSSHY